MHHSQAVRDCRRCCTNVWSSGYQEVAEAAGGAGKFAGRGLGQKLLKASAEELPDSVHRVLRWDGSVSPGWVGAIGDAAACKELLESEGLTFDPAGRADPVRHVDITKVTAAPGASAAVTSTANGADEPAADVDGASSAHT